MHPQEAEDGCPLTAQRKYRDTFINRHPEVFLFLSKKTSDIKVFCERLSERRYGSIPDQTVKRLIVKETESVSYLQSLCNQIQGPLPHQKKLSSIFM